jgi:hypothetical protein
VSQNKINKSSEEIHKSHVMWSEAQEVPSCTHV